MDRIPCFILCFFNVDATKKSLEYFSKFKDRLELIVIENFSKYTEEYLKPYILDLLNKEKIDHYFLFDENIKGKALETIFRENVCNWRNSKYLIITHGDITINPDTWLDEELDVLENHKDFLVCGLGIELEYLKDIHPKGAWGYPDPICDHGTFYEGITGGGHVALWRVEGFGEYFDWILQNNLHVIDSNQHPFCYTIKKMKWGRTKNSLARHAAWEYNLMPNHEYCILYKGYGKTYEQIYLHEGYSNYTHYTKGNSIYIVI